jgi:hypothetical protein
MIQDLSIFLNGGGHLNIPKGETFVTRVLEIHKGLSYKNLYWEHYQMGNSLIPSLKQGLIHITQD